MSSNYHSLPTINTPKTYKYFLKNSYKCGSNVENYVKSSKSTGFIGLA